MSFTQGLSGLNAASKDLEVIGNNVANVETVGFKGSQAQFADVFAASLGGASPASQIGLGTKLATVAQQFTQGSISSTNNPLDMAINGPGFFILQGISGTGYSRNGQFQVDKNGSIVTSTGQNLQGYPAVNGIVSNGGPTSNLVISTASIPPVQTNSIAVGLNLDSRATPPVVSLFNPNDASSYSYSTSSTVYDSLGNMRMDTMYFQLAAPATPSAAVNPGVQGPIATGNNPVAIGATTVSYPAPGPGPNIGQTIGGGIFPPGTTVVSVNTAAIPPTFTASAPAIVADPGNSLTFGGFVNSVATTTGLYVGEEVGPTGSGITITSVNATNNTFTTSGDITPLIVAGLLSFGPTTTTNIASTNTSSTVTVGNVIGLVVGQTVNQGGPGNFPAGTTITSINTTNNTFTTSAPAGVGAVPGIETFGAVSGNTWNIYTTLADPTGAPGTFLYPASALPSASAPWQALGTLTFNGVTGVLAPTSPTQLSLPAGFLPSFPGLTTSPLIGINYDFTGATQYGASSAVTQMTVNGYTSGNLVGYSASADGTITGNYSNNQTQLLGQVALATFANNQGLQPLGNNEWAATNASGAALKGVPGVGLNGVLQTSSVEGSNVDLTSELVNMITAQRNYQANSQTIKVQDAVLQTLLSMR